MANLLNAIEFAAMKHRDQRRKDPFGTPYINHPIGVASLIANIGGVEDVKVLQAAILHDTVEDTNTTFEEIEENFGLEVRNIVAEVTDNKSLSKVDRKKKQVINAPNKSTGAKIVKLADKLHNLTDLLNNPPKSWTTEYIHGYFVWCYFVVAGLRGTNIGLEKALDDMFKKVITSFDPNVLQEQLDNYYKLC